MSQAPSLNYTLRPGQNVRDEVVRILREISARAEFLGSNAQAPEEEAIHEGRLLIKRLRGLMWFARPALAPTIYKHVQAQLRKAAGLLAGQRDLVATRTTLDTLKRKVTRKRDAEAITRICRREIEALLSGSGEAAVSPRILREAMASVGACVAEMERGVPPCEQWPPAPKRVEKAIHSAHKAERKARQTKRDIDFHTWRKKAKRLMYQLELTQPEPTPHMAQVIARVEELQRELGEYHDRVVAGERLRKISPLPASARRVLGLLSKSKKQVRKNARKISRRIEKTI